MATSYCVFNNSYFTTNVTICAAIFNLSTSTIIRILQVTLLTHSMNYQAVQLSASTVSLKKASDVYFQKGNIINPECIRGFVAGHLKGIITCSSLISSSTVNAQIIRQTRVFSDKPQTSSYNVPNRDLTFSIYNYSDIITQPITLRRNDSFYVEVPSATNQLATNIKFSIEDI